MIYGFIKQSDGHIRGVFRTRRGHDHPSVSTAEPLDIGN
jgi:hypothetical protein